MSTEGDAFAQFWADNGLASRTIEVGATQTLVPPQTVLNADKRATLPRILSTSKQSSQLEVGGEIGKGGMGVVRLARQIALHRDVAIKQVRDDRRTERHATELLQEGLLVGALEHPNIIPVYMLGEDDDGFPTIVMKRIEGENWGEILRGGEVRGDGDPLGWHLEVLMDVCNAVHFAHSRGIVHRDLKPDNVMVGPFGEVYLLDWGIAVSLDDADDHPFPRARDATDVAGTPAYMAPEQVRGDAFALTPRTDVYLLGAMLHEVVTGTVPHDGATMFEIMHHAYQSNPIEYPRAPAEIARICQRAMAAAPEQRYGSADELRRALAGFLRHRESMELATQGTTSTKELVSSIRADELERCDELYARARFAFDAALATWPENDDAVAGREVLVATMARFELDRGDGRAARRLLSELAEPDAAMWAEVERLDEQLGAQAEKAAKLDEVIADADMAQYAGWRGVVLWCIAFDWLLSYAFYLVFKPAQIWWAVLGFGTLALGTTIALLARKRFSANLVNRQLLAAYAVCTAVLGFSHVAAEILNFKVAVAAFIDILGFAAVGAVMTTAIDRRFAPAVVMHLAGVLWILFSPREAIAALCFTCFLGEAFIGTIALFDWWGARQRT